MANVYTRRSRFPRNTSGKDFGPNLKHVICEEEEETRRVNSPSRLNRPDPSGITLQPSLSNSNETIQIWHPPLGDYSLKRPEMMRHIQKVNFTSGKLLWPVRWEDRQKPPPITYTEDGTSYRADYAWPRFPEPWMIPNLYTTREAAHRFQRVAKMGVPQLAVPKVYEPIPPIEGKKPGVYRCPEKKEPEKKVQMPAGCMSNQQPSMYTYEYEDPTCEKPPRRPCHNRACNNEPAVNVRPRCERKVVPKVVMPAGCLSNEERDTRPWACCLEQPRVPKECPPEPEPPKRVIFV